MRRQVIPSDQQCLDPNFESFLTHQLRAEYSGEESLSSDMPRRRKGWTPNHYFDQREMHRRRPLAVNPVTLNNSGVAEAANSAMFPTDAAQRPNIVSTFVRPRQSAVAMRGTSLVRDKNGTYQSIEALLAPKARVPGIMEACVHTLGLQVMPTDNGAQVKRRRTPMGPLELIGSVNLVLRLVNQDASRNITVEVWRGEQGNRYGLYFDHSNGSQFLSIGGNQGPQGVADRPNQPANSLVELPQGSSGRLPPTPPPFDLNNNQINMPVRSSHGLEGDADILVIPQRTTSGLLPAALDMNLSAFDFNLLDTFDASQVFPQGSWGLMPMAVTLDENMLTGISTQIMNPTQENRQDNQLLSPNDLVTADLVAEEHMNHHQKAPDGFCPRCFDNALSGTAD